MTAKNKFWAIAWITKAVIRCGSAHRRQVADFHIITKERPWICLLYTSDAADDV